MRVACTKKRDPRYLNYWRIWRSDQSGFRMNSERLKEQGFLSKS